MRSVGKCLNFQSLLAIAVVAIVSPSVVLGYPEYFEQRFAINGTDCKAKPSVDVQYGSHGTPKWDRPGVGFTIQQWGKSLLKSGGFRAGGRYNITVYFDQPRHALAYSSYGTLSYHERPTPGGRTCPNRLPFGPGAGFEPQRSFSFEIQVPHDAPSVDVTVVSTPSPLSNFLVGRLTMTVNASQEAKQSSTTPGTPAAAAKAPTPAPAAAAPLPSPPPSSPSTSSEANKGSPALPAMKVPTASPSSPAVPPAAKQQTPATAASVQAASPPPTAAAASSPPAAAKSVSASAPSSAAMSLAPPGTVPNPSAPYSA